MWAFIWTLTAVAVIAFGFFIMRKIDRFLGNAEAEKLKPALRVGFSDPLVADTVSELLDRFAQKHPDVPVQLFSGSDEKLLHELAREKLDAIFIHERTEVFMRKQWGAGFVSLAVPDEMKYDGLPIQPIHQGPVRQRVLWNQNKDGLGNCFIDSLPPVAEEQWKNEKEVL